MSIYTGINGHLDDVPVDKIKAFDAEFKKLYEGKTRRHRYRDRKDKKKLDPEVTQKLDAAIKEFKQIFSKKG